MSDAFRCPVTLPADASVVLFLGFPLRATSRKVERSSVMVSTTVTTCISIAKLWSYLEPSLLEALIITVLHAWVDLDIPSSLVSVLAFPIMLG